MPLRSLRRCLMWPQTQRLGQLWSIRLTRLVVQLLPNRGTRYNSWQKMFYLICGQGALLGCCAHPVCIFSLTTVVCVGSGMRTAKHSSFITAACTLLFMSSTGVHVSLPPGLELLSVLVCTVTRHAHTHLSTLNTAPHCGRRSSSPYTMGFNQDHIDRQMEEAFGPHLLSFQYKRPAETAQETPTREVKTAKGAEGKGVGSAQSSADPKGNGRGRGRAQNKSWGSGGGGFNGGLQSAQTPSQSGQAFIPDAQMCRLMARTIVDQADTIAVLRQSTAWVMWLQTTQPSLIPTMAAAAALWKEKVGDEASELYGLPLRVALLWALLRTLRATLESPPPELLTDARERKWIDQQGNWVYLRWNRATRTLEPDANRQSLNQTDLIALLKTTGTLSDGETVSRFAATRRLVESMEGVVTFKVDIQFRSPRANQLYANLEQMAGLSPLCLLGLSLRKESYRRSNGIQKLAEWCG